VKLFFQVVAFIAVLSALVWAKKTYLDKPKPSEQVSTAPIRASVPRTTSAAPQPESQPQTATLQEENNAIANLLNKFAGPKKPEDRARARLESFMAAWKEGGTSLNDARQAAACLFSRGMRFIPNADEIRDAYNGFVAFRREKNLDTAITDYSVGNGMRDHDDAHGDFTQFDVTINGVGYTMGVPDKPNPIFWIR